MQKIQRPLLHFMSSIFLHYNIYVYAPSTKTTSVSQTSLGTAWYVPSASPQASTKAWVSRYEFFLSKSPLLPAYIILSRAEPFWVRFCYNNQRRGSEVVTQQAHTCLLTDQVSQSRPRIHFLMFYMLYFNCNDVWVSIRRRRDLICITSVKAGCLHRLTHYCRYANRHSTHTSRVARDTEVASGMLILFLSYFRQGVLYFFVRKNFKMILQRT